MPHIEKACSRCGVAFTCEMKGSCWCSEVRVDAATLEDLRARYDDCLCEACLRTAGTTAGGGKLSQL